MSVDKSEVILRCMNCDSKTALLGTSAPVTFTPFQVPACRICLGDAPRAVGKLKETIATLTVERDAARADARYRSLPFAPLDPNAEGKAEGEAVDICYAGSMIYRCEDAAHPSGVHRHGELWCQRFDQVPADSKDVVP